MGVWPLGNLRCVGIRVLSAQDIDDVCAFALERLAAPAADPVRVAQDLVAHLAAGWPQAPALTPVLPLAMAASALEGMLDGDEARHAAQGAWRMAALIGAEVLALQSETENQAPTVAALHARFGPGA